MKRNIVFSFFVFLLIGGIMSCDLLNGDDDDHRDDDNHRDAGMLTVAEAKNLPEDTYVTIQCRVAANIYGARYTFRDETGDITVKIEGRLWSGFTVSDTIMVEIYGEVDWENGQQEIDVKRIRTL